MRLGKQRHESKYMAVQYFYKEHHWSINWMCKQLGIARSAYYKWIHRCIPEQEKENIKLAELIREYDDRFGHILGYRRMTNWINRLNQSNYSEKRVHRIMKKLGIHAIIRKKKKKYLAIKPEETVENILQRDFYATEPNQKWVTDVTEFKIPGERNKKLYLSAILDLYDRYPIAFVISKRNDNRLVFKTFDEAVRQEPDAHPLVHSDRGFQYTSAQFYTRLKKHHMKQSMSRVAHCIDNGPMEGFWGILKREMYYKQRFNDRSSLITAIANYIDYYNNQRLQRKLHVMTPMKYHEQYTKAA